MPVLITHVERKAESKREFSVRLSLFACLSKDLSSTSAIVSLAEVDREVLAEEPQFFCFASGV
ncbi:hypothetical protein M3212_11730 [Alkalihalobacillus oceani]|uniref:hypothetical protein n=1 Tax=Halalkalibacter oceani TaxID=1653776 RepID=UPI002041F828|nr:hypothetical protein [Halalkalibacter oceani]MCM3761453.1 hypothetical protein [Halalkalibacter oceani]